MKFKKCSHHPHIFKIIFDVGFDQLATYELCTNCYQMSVFQDFVVSKEILSEINNTPKKTDSSFLSLENRLKKIEEKLVK